MGNKEKLFSIALASLILILMMVSIAGAAPFAYIPNNGGNNISIIDTATNMVTASVNVGGGLGVAVSPDGAKVHVAQQGAGTVSVINTTTNTVTATINTGVASSPSCIAINPTGTKVYVTNEAFTNAVSVIDTTTNNVIATIPVGSDPFGVVVSPDGTKVYVANQGNNNISVINTTTNTVIDSVPVGVGPAGVAIAPDGTKVYVGNGFSNTVSVIDTTTDTVIDSVPVGVAPSGITVNPAGTEVYVANGNSGTVSVINTTTDTVSDTVNVGSNLFGVAITPDGTKVYVIQYMINTVSVIDTATKMVTASVPVGIRPFAFGQFIGPLPVLPVANFTTNVTSGYLPLTVQLTNLSTNATGVYWDFGDGTNSTQSNPIHTYSTAGNFLVNLTAINENGTNSTTAIITVNAIPPIPVANFTATPTSGTVPLNVSFTDTTVGTPTSWKWDFGDGKSSNSQNPSHIYQSAGTYTVSLTVKNKNGTNTTTKTNYIAATNPLLIANFSATPTSGTARLTVSFTDTSIGTPTSWKWDFGDKGTSTKQNPTEVYKKPGTYTVSLTVKDGFGTNTTTKTGYITVS